MRERVLQGCGAALVAAFVAGAAGPAAAQINLPSDVKSTCPVSSSTFDGWFASGTPTANGAVTEADSVAFPTDNTLCDFYKFGAQMFLWLTSPDGDGLVLDGPAIFTVLPANNHGVRHLVDNANDSGPMKMALRSEKFDDIGEIGQAGGGGVLMSQDNSLVYYGVHVNDVYAYFLTGQKDGYKSLGSATKFPRNKSDLTAVKDYVADKFPNAKLPAAEALAMELKTSWVEASSVRNPDDFVTIHAEVPAYNQSADNTKWTRDGTRTTKLALVGMHVVGTVQNHPEFVWITYEHVANTPNAAYWYTDTNGNLKEVTDPSDADYLFAAKGSMLHETQANVECMKEDSSGNIVANTSGGNPVCQGGIVPSNTLRINPWGSPSSKDSAENNTLLLSLNNSVISQLKSGDVRKNYVQIGGIWTSAPSASSDAPIPDATKNIKPPFASDDLRGSLDLANTTMETYNQNADCFSCHSLEAGAENSFAAFSLSHIYSQIAPLPTN